MKKKKNATLDIDEFDAPRTSSESLASFPSSVGMDFSNLFPSLQNNGLKEFDISWFSQKYCNCVWEDDLLIHLQKFKTSNGEALPISLGIAPMSRLLSIYDVTHVKYETRLCLIMMIIKERLLKKYLEVLYSRISITFKNLIPPKWDGSNPVSLFSPTSKITLVH